MTNLQVYKGVWNCNVVLKTATILHSSIRKKGERKREEVGEGGKDERKIKIINLGQ